MWIFQMLHRPGEAEPARASRPAAPTVRTREEWDEAFDQWAAKAHPEYRQQGDGAQAARNYQSLREYYLQLRQEGLGSPAAEKYLSYFTNREGGSESVLSYYNLDAGQMKKFGELADQFLHDQTNYGSRKDPKSIPEEIRYFENGGGLLSSGHGADSVMRWLFISLRNSVGENGKLNAMFGAIYDRCFSAFKDDTAFLNRSLSKPTEPLMGR